jgi:cytochrome b translational activator protein CBS2
VRSRVEAEDISGFPEESVDEEDMIHNLIVTIPAGQVVQALERIKHRLDQRSTICLVNDGLGVAEALIEAYFPIESRRPVFLLGHFSAHLGPAEEAFSVSEVRQGRLYLSIFSPQAPGPAMPFRIKRHPPPERTVRATHLIRLLTAIPGLHASGYPMTSFFKYKLPMMAFRSIVDPVSVLLDCTYDKLLTNRYARQLMDRLLGELTGVVAALPELRDSEEFRQSAIDASLRKDVFKKLLAHRTANTRMRTQISRGWDTDIDFLSGYFVRRGRQVRANVTALDSIMGAVKAKNRTVTDQMEEELPMEVGPP